MLPTMPTSVQPGLKLRTRITKRDCNKRVEAVNESPTITTDTESSLEKAETRSNPDSINIKELTRQCSKHVKWKETCLRANQTKNLCIILMPYRLPFLKPLCPKIEAKT